MAPKVVEYLSNFFATYASRIYPFSYPSLPIVVLFLSCRRIPVRQHPPFSSYFQRLITASVIAMLPAEFPP
jgi:hypothetical protein